MLSYLSSMFVGHYLLITLTQKEKGKRIKIINGNFCHEMRNSAPKSGHKVS